MFYLAICLQMSSKLHVLFGHLSIDVFQTICFTWPIIHEFVPNYVFYLTIYLWMCSKLHDFLDHLSKNEGSNCIINLTTYRILLDYLSRDVFKTT